MINYDLDIFRTHDQKQKKRSQSQTRQNRYGRIRVYNNALKDTSAKEKRGGKQKDENIS